MAIGGLIPPKMVEWSVSEKGERKFLLPLADKMDGVWLDAEHIRESAGVGEKLIIKLRDDQNIMLGGIEGVITEKNGVRYMEIVTLEGGTLLEEEWEPWLDESDKLKWVLPLGYEGEAYFLGVWLAKDLGVRKIFGWNELVTDTKMEYIDEKVKHLVAEGRKSNFLETGRVVLRGELELRIEEAKLNGQDGLKALLLSPDGEEAVLLGEIYCDGEESEVVDLSVTSRGEIKLPVKEALMKMCSELMEEWPERYKDAHGVMVDVEDSLVYLVSYYLRHHYENVRVWALSGDHWGQYVVLDQDRVKRLVDYWLGF